MSVFLSDNFKLQPDADCWSFVADHLEIRILYSSGSMLPNPGTQKNKE